MFVVEGALLLTACLQVFHVMKGNIITLLIWNVYLVLLGHFHLVVVLVLIRGKLSLPDLLSHQKDFKALSQVIVPHLVPSITTAQSKIINKVSFLKKVLVNFRLALLFFNKLNIMPNRNCTFF